MDHVVVTATRTEKRIADSPVLTTVVSERNITRAAALSTLEALQDNVPGIVVIPNAMGNNLRIKGLTSRYILMLVDGERLVGEGAGGNVNLDQIDVSSIRRIEIVDGASSALYGSNAVGAVVNVITKEPSHNIELGASQSMESQRTLRSRVDVGSAFDHFSVRAGGFRNSSDGFGANGSGPYAARYADYGANMKLAWRPTSRVDANVTGRWFRHETFNPAGSMNTAHDMTRNLALGVAGGFRNSASTNSLRLSVNFDKFFDLDILEKRNDEQRLAGHATQISSRVVDTFTPSAAWEVVAGAEHNHESNYATTTLGATPTTKTLNDINLFAQALYKPTSKFDIVGGARITRHSSFGAAFTPKLSLMYRAGDFKLRGGVGTAFRAPTIKELYYDFDHQGMFRILGNPDLKAERGVHSSLSAEYTHGNFNISAAGYLNRIADKITQYDNIGAGGAAEKRYTNVSHATLQGVDITVTATIADRVTLRGNYSFCDATDASTGDQLPGNVKHSATASATWNGHIADSPFSLQFAGRAGSATTYFDEMVAGGTVATRAKPYSVWKIALVKPFVVARKHVFEITAKVDNLFDFHDRSFIDPGRRYMLGVSYKFRHSKFVPTQNK
jgi:outer membrane receptor for ferrienterochelin and colicins